MPAEVEPDGPGEDVQRWGGLRNAHRKPLGGGWGPRGARQCWQNRALLFGLELLF